MKIICIGQNYREHIKELGHEMPSKPVFFFKPDTALLLRNRPFYLPDFSNEIHYETELIVRISKVGKNIPEKYVEDFYDSVSLGFDFTARDLQREASAKGLPWELSKGFDYSAAIGKWINKNELPGFNSLKFNLKLNGKFVQKGDASDMIFGIDKIISYISSFMTLHIGDVIFTGTPSGVGKLKIGDLLEAYLGEEKLLYCNIK